MGDVGRGRNKRQPPVALVAEWPEVAADDPVVEVARQLALNLRAAIGGESVRVVAERAQVNYTAVYAILGGGGWPDLLAVAKLEAGLGVDLYPTGVARGRE